MTKFHIPNFCAFFWGDWGGILSGSEPLTFKNRPQVVEPIDSHAQSYVARKMAQVADEKRPKFVINVGDVVEMGWENAGIQPIHPLVNIQKTMERSTILNKKTHCKWQFSIANC